MTKGLRKYKKYNKADDFLMIRETICIIITNTWTSLGFGSQVALGK